MEIACTRAEMIARMPLYQRYFTDHKASEHEEAVSNAQAVLWGLNPDTDGADVCARARAWMSRQGPGYRDFSRWSSSRNLSRAMDLSTRYMLMPLPPPRPKRRGQSGNFLFHEGKRYKIPTTRIADQERSNVSVLRPFPKAFGIQVFVHTNDHVPVHIHIQLLGGPETRYLWPQLVPMKGDDPLPGNGTKLLEDYLAKYGKEVSEKLRRVYGEMNLTS